jgi:hypothetical protein
MRNKNVKKANVDFIIRYNQPRGGISWGKNYKINEQIITYHFPHLSFSSKALKSEREIDDPPCWKSVLGISLSLSLSLLVRVFVQNGEQGF